MTMMPHYYYIARLMMAMMLYQDIDVDVGDALLLLLKASYLGSWS